MGVKAGVRFLPSTLVLIVMGPIAGRLADRVGPKVLMTVGLVATSGSLFWQSFIEVGTSYSLLLGAFVLMGVGMGLVMSPMSTAAMNAACKDGPSARWGRCPWRRRAAGVEP